MCMCPYLPFGLRDAQSTIFTCSNALPFKSKLWGTN